jgi:hypothetical protein
MRKDGGGRGGKNIDWQNLWRGKRVHLTALWGTARAQISSHVLKGKSHALIKCPFPRDALSVREKSEKLYVGVFLFIITLTFFSKKRSILQDFDQYTEHRVAPTTLQRHNTENLK